MMSMYNAQYDDYQLTAAIPDLSEDQKEILRTKKEIITEVYPMIQIYISYAESGTIPSVETETLIIQQLNRLLTL